jgi:hypothetical protein
VYSLLKAHFNPGAFILLAVLFRVLLPDISWLSFFAIIITLHQFLLLFNSIGSIIPIRYLFGFFLCIQMLIGPTLAYNGIDQYQYFLYRMQVPEVAYFSYALPAVLLFIIGLHLRAGNFAGEVVDLDSLKKFNDRNPNLAFILIGIGFVSSIISPIFPSEVSLILYLLGGFKFIGAFLLILGGKKMKSWLIIVIFSSIITSSLSEGMFHDLLTWIIFTGFIVALRIRPNVLTKVLFTVAFVILAILIQQLKGAYRSALGSGKEGGVETFVQVYERQNDRGIFSLGGLAPSAVRINQGFILTHVMKTVPTKVPYSEGTELGQVIEAAVLPRIIAPNKLVAGDRQLFNKYTGLQVREGTSMGLGSMSDGYINFGVLGGCVFMFALGLLYSEVLILFQKVSITFSIAILFTALVFYHPIRPDNELQTVLGHLVKSCVLLWATYYFSKRSFNLEPSESPLPANLR